MLDLKSLALLTGQALVVGEFSDEVRDSRAELVFEFEQSGLGVFDRVVQQRGRDGLGVGDVADVHQQVGHCYRMVDVGNCLDALAALMPMFMSGEGERLEWQLVVFFLVRL